MTDILIRNVPDRVVAKLKALAEAEGLGADHIVELNNTLRPYTAEERVAASRAALARYPTPLQPLTKAEMREGMEE